MSIATELQNLNDNILSAYDAVATKGGTVSANKNMANLASAIASIEGGGGGGGSPDTTFWAGGKNARLIGSYEYTLNLANDTSYSSTTPSTSSKTIFEASQAAYRQTQTGINLADYDYIAILDVVIPHVYTSLPTVANIDIVVLKSLYHIGRRIESTATTPNHNTMPYGFTAGTTLYRTRTSPQMSTAATTAYGIGASTVAPTFGTTSSATTNIYLPNPSIVIRTYPYYMASSAWADIDAANTNINIRWQMFQIDKPGITTKLYAMGYDEAKARGFTTNEVNI